MFIRKPLCLGLAAQNARDTANAFILQARAQRLRKHAPHLGGTTAASQCQGKISPGLATVAASVQSPAWE